MKKIKLFIDGSLNPQKKIGYGAYLLLKDEEEKLENLKNKIVLKRFEDTSSTKLEVETFLWAIKDIDIKDLKIDIYTDCQNLIGLESRKEKLQKSQYLNSKGKLIKNHLLYKEFFILIEKYNLKFFKIKGHKKNSLKDDMDKIFNLVDKASREYLRKDISGELED